MSELGLVRDLTNLGDLAVLLPVAFTMFVWLAFSPTWRPAASWVLALSVCLGGTGFLKIAFFVCPPAATLHSPSGHVSLSTLVYGGLALVLSAKGSTWHRVGTIGLGVAVAGAIAVTRVVLNSHTVLETVMGLALGALALGIFGAGYYSQARSTASLRPLLLSVAIVIVALHGQQLHAEELVRAIGDFLRSDGLSCP